MFYLKTDLPVPDAVLADLKTRNVPEARERRGVIASLLREELGEDPETVHVLDPAGTFHLVHHATFRHREPVIVRSSVGEIFDRDLTLYIDAWAHRSLGEMQVHAPAVLSIVVDRDRADFDFMIMDFATGTNMRDVREEDIDRPIMLASVGEALKQIHHLSGQGAGLIDVEKLSADDAGVIQGVQDRWDDYVMLRLGDHIGTCVETGLLPHLEGEEITGYFKDLKPVLSGVPLQFLHGDPGNHNIFVDGTQITNIVDWEDALIGDPLFDVAMWATFQPPRRFAGFFEGYGLDMGDEAIRLRMALYYLRITLSKAVHRHRFGYADRPARPTMAQRLGFALEALRRARSTQTSEVFH